MNLFQATLLSTKRTAITYITHDSINKPAYVLKVIRHDYCDRVEADAHIVEAYHLEVFRVTYPDKSGVRTWGEPKIADAAHFVVTLSPRSELEAFLTLHDYIADRGWQPVEDDDNKLLEG